jgi:OOP family OmpA-OmpF porin
VVVAGPPPVVPTDVDGDGRLNVGDCCPDEPEDRDGFADEDGCVDRDDDGDGILDAQNYVDGAWTNSDHKFENGIEIDCRDAPEDRDGFEDEDGCPDHLVVTIRCDQQLAAPIHFDRSGRLERAASKSLEDVAFAVSVMLKDDIWIDAHVDASGSDEASRRLTDRVVERVIDQLVGRGVPRERLRPRSYGENVPIADNKLAAGRAANRRVEFRIADCKEPARPVGRPQGQLRVCR